MAEPFFSIIIPIYNTVPEQIEFCMNSLTNQTMGDIEIILVDDGSNIDCANQCDAFAAKDPRVRVIHQPNQGVAIARNNGIKSATAEWILFVDADDWLELDAFEVLRNELTGSNLNILLSKHVRENDDNTQTFPEYQIQPNLTYDLTDPKTRELWYNAVIAPLFGKVAPLYYSWDKVFRRSFLLDNSLFFPEGIAKSEDKIFFLQCLEHLTSIRQIDRTFYHYRIQESSACPHHPADIIAIDADWVPKERKESGELDFWDIHDHSYGTDAGNPDESQYGDWRGIGVLFARAERFSISNLHIVESHGWGISLEDCSYGRIEKRKAVRIDPGGFHLPYLCSAFILMHVSTMDTRSTLIRAASSTALITIFSSSLFRSEISFSRTYGFTKNPTPRFASITPSWLSAYKTFCVVAWLTPKSSASFRTDGILSPGRNSPDMIFNSTLAFTFSHTD